MIVTGLIRHVRSATRRSVAESAAYGDRARARPHQPDRAGAAVLRAARVRLRLTALTGIEAIANGVPAFRPPKSRNAATTLALLGGIAVTMFAGVTALALVTNVHVTRERLRPDRLPGTARPSRSARSSPSSAAATFGGDHSIGFYYIQAATALVLVLAANTAFNGFPLLGSVLAQDRFLPRQLHTRGDKLVYSNGILLLAGFAVLLIVAFDADVTRLIQLYIIGVFTSFTHRPVGHGPALEPGAAHRARTRRSGGGCSRSQVINADRRHR